MRHVSAHASLIPELERVIQQGSPDRCADMLSDITILFLGGSDRFNDDHVAVFDEVFARLIVDIETRARARLSGLLASIENAPPKLVLRLARDDDIRVAAPILEHSPRLADDDLCDIAGSKGQGHLLAISGRRGISETVTDVLVWRGNREVALTVADNQSARFTQRGFSTLVERAADDSVLAEKVGGRTDIPPRLFQTLVMQATDIVQQRLLAKARPETAAEIRRVLALVSEEIGARASTAHDYARAKATVFALKERGELGEPALTAFTKSGRFEETVTALAELSAIPVETVERLMGGDRPDPILILCKAAGFDWQTVRALILARRGGKGTSTQALDLAYANFERLSPSTAQRVTRFWRVQPGYA